MRLCVALSAMLTVAGPVAGPVAADPFDQALAALRAGDLGTGAALFDGLARGGDGDAMYNLALLYHQGIGLPQNGDMALYWAWRARLTAVPRALALVDLLMPVAPKERRALLHEKLLAEAGALPTTDVAGAALNFVRMALIEDALAAKPDRVQIYVWYSLAAALGHPGAAGLRDGAFARLTPKEAQGAEARAMAGFGAWCLGQTGSAPGVCAVLAEGLEQGVSENG